MLGISHWIDKRAQITPSRIALINDVRKLSYLEMAQEVNQMARCLAEYYQIRQGDRVAILATNSIEYVQLLFALAKLGAVVVPLNTRLTAAELEFQLQDSGALALIVSADYFKTGSSLKQACSLQHLIALQDVSESSNPAFLQLFSFYESTSYEPAAVNWSSPFIICYTSGTTGRPKGAVLSHENMYWNAINNILSLEINSNDRVLTILPLFHIGGIGLFAFPALLAGGSVIVPDRFDPEHVLQVIEQEQVSIIMGVPTIFELLRKAARFKTTDYESVRWFYSGGAPCPHELLHFYHEQGLPLGQGFGLTETSPTVFLLSKEDYRRKIGSVGKPVMYCEVRIVNEAGLEAEPNEVGELLVRGPNVIKEYWNLPEEQGKSFRDGWFYTGDLAKRDEEGFYYIAGRKKEMIISGGENIYPIEVEQVLYRHPALDEVSVIGVPHEKWGEVPLAILSLKTSHTASSTTEAIIKELEQHCLEHLAKYKCPARYEIVSALPKNATGKIDKAYLKKKFTNISKGSESR